MLRALVCLVVLSGCKERFKAPSSSMMPTIELGEIFAISSGEVERGDIVVFDQPCTPERRYVKRVIALGGDAVEVRCGVVHINGKPIETSLVAATATYQDVDSDPTRTFTREASRYRETYNGHTYEIFDEIERPVAKQPASKDFPLDELPSCRLTYDSSAPGGPVGKLVKTGEPDGCKLHKHFVVPSDTLFVLGDNRSNSNDSRFWGVVPKANVRGRVD